VGALRSARGSRGRPARNGRRTRRFGGDGAAAAFAIDFDRSDDALLARARAIDGVRSLSCAPHASGVRMRVELDEREGTFTELLRAVSANGICVRSVEREIAMPFEAFSLLAGVPHAD
jgi:hypothetical protein